ncbi:MAG: serine/threonine protein kinase, partial [Chloroflexota bacterium]|nr:serine/threonine protein kinase [Chloroflexota bacterium]
MQLGDVIHNGDYRIEAIAGEGSFATVYRAVHLKLNVVRAVKALRPEAYEVNDKIFSDYRQRFKTEFQIAASLDHPNVIKVYDLGEDEGRPYAILEYALGGSVSDQIKKQGPLPIDRAVQILLDCVAGLGALHERLSLVHRDVKPSNILLDNQLHAKIADLGLAQVGGGQSSMRSELGSKAVEHPGTPAYCSPEHHSWEPLSPTSDVFSLGCVMFEMLTGQVWKDV